MDEALIIPVGKGNYSFESPDREAAFYKDLAYGNPDSYYAYREEWRRREMMHDVGEYPVLLDLELSTICNLQCPFCWTTTESYKKRANYDFMDFDLFCNIINQAEGHIPAIRLSLNGESTLHPKFIECIKYAKDHGIVEVSFLTNGSKLDPDFFEKIMLAGADWITISFDGLYEEYEKNRYPLKFDEMYERLTKMKEIKARYRTSKPVIKLQTIWPAIEKDPQAYYDKMSPVCDFLAFNPLCDYHSETPKDGNIYEDNFICQRLYSRLLIRSNGIVPLCNSDDKTEYIVGDAKTHSIHELWHNEEMQKMRDYHKSQKPLGDIVPCRSCFVPRKTRDDIYRYGNREIIVKNIL